MIVPMSKVYVASTRIDKDNLLNGLRDLGVMHIIPVDPDKAEPDEKMLHKIEQFKTAIQILEAHKPDGNPPKLKIDKAVEEVHRIIRNSNERTNRLNTLHRHLEQIKVWGNTKLDDLKALDDSGLEASFYTVPLADISKIDALCVQNLRNVSKDKALVAVVTKPGQKPELPESAVLIERPKTDKPAILAEAKKIDQALKADKAELDTLCHYHDQMKSELATLQELLHFSQASKSGLTNEELFAIQGWVPHEEVSGLAEKLHQKGVQAAVHSLEPAEDEEPPTLIRYPKWANPIKSLFAILGTKPGYREYDLAPFFMLAMPLFTAMLIGDAGYGITFILIGLLFYKKLTKATKSTSGGQLILTFGMATTIWGMLTINYFGVGMQQFASWAGVSIKELLAGEGSGIWAGIGRAAHSIGYLWRENSQAGQHLIMKISFTIAVIHLSIAHIRQFIGMFPHQKAIAELGWVSFTGGIYAIIWQMFFKSNVFGSEMVTFALLGAGAGLVILFANPDKNPLKRLGFGIMGNLMSFVNVFGDSMSYIRLMAVGMSSYYIAFAFNGLAGDLCAGNSLMIPVSAIVLIIAHAMNIGLCLVAIFAHGVRLNMLEFSTNAGVEWSGQQFTPFARETVSAN